MITDEKIVSPFTAFTGDEKGQRVLITGLHGFTGYYLAQELAAAGYRVFGTAIAGEPTAENIFTVDLCDRARVAEVVALVQPDVVVHLAAIAFVAHADAQAMYCVNIVGTRNLLQALAENKKTPSLVLLVSSANIYGNAAQELIDESVMPAPMNDYAVSKMAMEHMAGLWRDRLPIVIARPFNYTGVGQSENFLLPKIVSHFRREAREIELGNLDVARDFSDVRMVVKTYRRLIEAAPVGETFNVCAGMAYSIDEILGMMSELAGYKIKVKVNPAFSRANEVKRLLGNNAKLARAIGDLSPIPLLQTLRWMLQAA
jgi:nucleoside-diphosphate-sugar epimerase